MVTLLDLKEGESGYIGHIEKEEFNIHFFEMGFAVGNLITVMQKAPFNGPLYLEVDGNFLCIRAESATQITVNAA